jgi:RNA polymerase sigma-54 factor
MKQKAAPQLQQMQRLIMAPKVQQSLAILQMARLDMEATLQLELEENPILELFDEQEAESIDSGEMEELQEFFDSEKELDFTERDFLILRELGEDFANHFSESDNFYTQKTAEEEDRKAFVESSISSPQTLSDLLLEQTRQELPEEAQAAAKIIIGYLDKNGFLSTPLEEIASWHGYRTSSLEEILLKLQQFDPPGIAARNLQECLLIQLHRQGKESSLACAIITSHFDDLLHNRIPKIAHSLRHSAENVTTAIERDIAKLDLHPGLLFHEKQNSIIIPDVTIRESEGKKGELEVFIHDECCFSLRLNSRYLQMLREPGLPSDTGDFIKKKITSARWLLRNLHQRSATLEKIARHLIQVQYAFFTLPKGQLTPLTMQQTADELGMHESTIARAVANKYIETPRGLFALRFFFTSGYATENGSEISSRTVKEQLKALIEKEDKKKPLSDAKLSELLKDSGVPCARRTVAKYREELKIGSAQQRRLWSSASKE